MSGDWVRWINRKPRRFNKLSLEKISESVRVYVYLVLTIQANARSRIVGNDASAFNVQQIFKDNFEAVVKRRVNLAEDVKRYQAVLDKASSKVDFSVGEGIYMMPSDMNLRISDSIAGYSKIILISKKGFGVAKNKLVNNKTNFIDIKPVSMTDKKPVIWTPETDKKPEIVTPEIDNKPIFELSKSPESLTKEERIAAVGVMHASIAAVWMIYK